MSVASFTFQRGLHHPVDPYQIVHALTLMHSLHIKSELIYDAAAQGGDGWKICENLRFCVQCGWLEHTRQPGLFNVTIAGAVLDWSFYREPVALNILGNGADWEALFVNGVLVDQCHAFRLVDLAEYAPIGSINIGDIPPEVNAVLQDCGEFPEGISLADALAFTGGR